MTSASAGTRMLQRTLRTYGASAGGLAIVGVVLFPIFWVVSAAFRTTRQLADPRPPLLPDAPTLASFHTALTTQMVPLGTSVTIGVLAATLSLAIALPAAYALANFKWRWTALLVLVTLVSQMIPNVMIATPLYLMFNQLHLLNSYTGLVLADSSVGIPFAVLLLRASFADISSEIRQAALIDGANELQVLLHIILPIGRTAVISAAVFCFLFAWGDFLYALTLDTNGDVNPLSLSIYSFLNGPSIDWGSLMAAATLSIVPGGLLLVLAQRYITAGLSAGAIKE
jgi:multiple sugar transport system permease protein